MTVRSFEVNMPQATLNDLRERLARTRWPDEVAGAGWDYFTNLAYMKELAGCWQSTFDWAAQEAALNQFSHFRADVNGLGIHFIHQRGVGPQLLPRLLLRGWPSSFVQMLKIIPLLSDPAAHRGEGADSFDVIVPDLPGYGFSDRPSERGMGVTLIAELMHRLMTEELGYERYAARGSDLGAGVVQQVCAGSS